MPPVLLYGVAMKEIVLITGGCRSGKSSYAMSLAESLQTARRCFVATCVPADEEMKARVARHQRDRGGDWETVECPLDIAAVIRQKAGEKTLVLVDCLTLWLNNILAETENQEEIEKRIDSLQQAIAGVSGTVIMVTNEVGCGIVPADRTTRLFRDMAGTVNRRMAEAADRVVWMVAGVPVIVKGAGGR